MALGFLILQPPFLFLLRLFSSANSYVACFLWRTSMNSMENVFGSFSCFFFYDFCHETLSLSNFGQLRYEYSWCKTRAFEATG